MLSEAGIGLAKADRRIAEAERNIRDVSSLIPHIANNGYSTEAVEHHLALMTQVLDHLKAKRREIEGMLGEA